MTEQQRKIARHMLFGSSTTKRSYRNRFVAGPGTAAYGTLCYMRAAGLVELRGDCHWRLTRSAAELVLLPGESLDPEDFPA